MCQRFTSHRVKVGVGGSTTVHGQYHFSPPPLVLVAERGNSQTSHKADKRVAASLSLCRREAGREVPLACLISLSPLSP
jgi:hypothetical protein